MVKDVRVFLTCGHSLRVHWRPASEGSVFACNANAGHGYTLGWVYWETIPPGPRIFNSRFEEEEEEEEEEK
jgi:hypothetical protein